MTKATMAKRKKNRFAIPPAIVKDMDSAMAVEAREALQRIEAQRRTIALMLLTKVVKHGSWTK